MMDVMQLEVLRQDGLAHLEIPQQLVSALRYEETEWSKFHLLDTEMIVEQQQGMVVMQAEQLNLTGVVLLVTLQQQVSVLKSVVMEQ